MPPKVQVQDASELRQRFADREHKKRLSSVNKSFLGDHFQELPLLQRLNWLHLPLLTLTPALALYGLLTSPWYLNTFLAAIGYYFFSGLGITAGYHRLWSHRAYKAKPWFEFLLMLMGTAAIQGSIRWWSRDHRAHHKHVDTELDPYAVSKGFWHAHIGWMLVKQDKKKIGRTDIRDLNTNWITAWQHYNYLPLALLMGFIVPTAICGLGWGDWRGGFFIAAIGRLVFVHHSTFAINSVAHYLGDETYTDGHSAKNSAITALITVGEGYHNFHHEFPSDYRNGVRWYQYDPTKWLIRALSWVGVTYDLKRFPSNEILKGAVQMRQKRLNQDKAKLNWGPAVDSLPTFTWEQIRAKVAAGAKWVVLDGCVLDLESFRGQHPGGDAIIENAKGKDVSAMFRGEVYRHSNAAHNLQRTFRVGRVRGYAVQADSTEGNRLD